MLRVGRKDGEIPGCDLQVFCCPKWRYVDPNRSFQPFLEILECPNMSNKNIFIPVKLISYDVHHPPMLFPKKSRRISYYFVCFSPPIFTPHSPPRWRHRTRDLRRKHHGIHGWQIRRLASSDGVGRQWLANKAGKGHRLSSAPWFGRVGFQVSMLGGGGTQKQRFCNPNHPQKKHTQRPKHQQQKKHAANTKICWFVPSMGMVMFHHHLLTFGYIETQAISPWEHAKAPIPSLAASCDYWASDFFQRQKHGIEVDGFLGITIPWRMHVVNIYLLKTYISPWMWPFFT